MIDNNNFIVIQGFMINELKLKGNELIIYAIIYGFSQIEGQEFTGSLNYLAQWTNSTKQGVLKNLKSLLDKGLISKSEVYNNGVKFVKYSITVLNKVKQGIKHSLPNNIEDNIDNIIEDNKKTQKERKDKRIEELGALVTSYTEDKDLRDILQDFITMRKEIKKPITPTGLKRLLSKLSKFTTLDREKIAILEQSISHNWQDIYSLKNNWSCSGNYYNNSHKIGLNDNKNDIDDLIEI